MCLLKIMKYTIYILMLFLAISGCKPGVPKEFIQQEEMGLILYDMHVADAYVSMIYVPDSARRVAAAYYKGIYKKYDIDSAIYAKSLSYYSEHPDLFSKVYEEVKNRLNKQKLTLVKADSLENVKVTKALKLKLKRDSTKRADSIAKTPAFKKEALKKALKKKADSIKRVDSISKVTLLKKASAKKHLDSIRLKTPVKRLKK